MDADINAGDDLPLTRISKSHIDDSAHALTELAGLLTSQNLNQASRSIRVRFGSLDHGSFFNPLLYGFSMIHVSNDGLPLDINDSRGIMYAIVLNHSVSRQVRTGLTFIAELIARQHLVDAALRSDSQLVNIDVEAEDSDLRTSAILNESLRNKDWRSTAIDIRTRAEDSGYHLHVELAKPLVTLEEIHLRTPTMRHIYNELSQVRDVVDRVVASMANSLTIKSSDSPQAFAKLANRFLDVGQLRQYTAHVIRDAFVTGNGYLRFDRSSGTPRLVRSEFVTPLESGDFSIVDNPGGTPELVRPKELLHMKIMNDTEGKIGVSLMEPFLIILSQLELAQKNLELREYVEERLKTAEAHELTQQANEFLLRTAAATLKRTEELLGSGFRSYPQPPQTLYFRGHSLMDHAIESLVSPFQPPQP